MSDTCHIQYTEHTYGTENDLQKLGVWRRIGPIPSPPSTGAGPDAPRPKYWLIYIHGGIWRDPRTTHLQARAAVDVLLGGTSTTTTSRIAGVASLDYRLSPHPAFPQDPAATPARRLRNARHPDHLADVRAALAFLRREYGVGGRRGLGRGGETEEEEEETPYVLYGHSCGATMALQVVMGLECGPGPDDEVPLPAAVVGFQGMYDLAGLNARFGGAYRDMIAGALGDDEELWRRVSPALFAGSFADAWAGGLAVLAYSPEDRWIDMAEIDAMEARLKQERPVVHVQTYRDLTGDHDDVAESGQTVARVLLETVARLDDLTRM